MVNREFIDSLSQKNADYNNPELAITASNLCDTISRDINTDSHRFIYELLQNADDASNEFGKLEIQIDFIGDYIIVSHKGSAFSKVDIESISSAGDGTKSGDINKTGFKGIGFKSVFSHSDFVIVKSKDFCFKFDKKHWSDYWKISWGAKSIWQQERRGKQKNEEIKMPWQIIPIWTDLPIELKNLSVFQDFTVSTIIRYDKVGNLKTALIELFSESQIVLFLRSQEVKITINTPQKLILEKSKNGEATALKRNGVVLSEWLIKTEQFDIPIEVQNEILADEKSPQKLKDAKRTEISFAIQKENEKLKVVNKENRLVFTYLPTSINYDFPFLVNASFLTDAGRQHLHQDVVWNNWIFRQIPLKFFSWIAQLAHKTSKFNKQILSVVPQKLVGSSKLEHSFNIGYKEALETIPFIPNLEGDLIKISESIFDKTSISNFLNTEILVKYINSKTSQRFSVLSFVPFLEPLSTLSRLGTEMFEIEDLEGLFNSEEFRSEHEIGENFKLISFLHEQAEVLSIGEEKNVWNQKIRSIPFIFDESNNLKSPKQIYFPSIEFLDDIKDKVSVIHQEVMNDISKNYPIKRWLEYLGVKEPSDVAFIEKSIIENDILITPENAIAIGRYLFKAHKKRILEDRHYNQLQKINFLTKDNTLKEAANLYLSDLFEPEIKLESTYNYDFYISELYHDSIDYKSEWKTFFLKIGVSESISIKRFDSVGTHNMQIFGFDIQYFYEGVNKAKAKSNYIGFPIWDIAQISKVTFIEFADQYQFSKLFWQQLLKKYKPSNFSGAPIMPMGYYNGYCSLEDYNKWVFKHHAIFPTVQGICLMATEVFLNSNEIKEITGDYLPIFDFEGTITKEWLEFLPFKRSLDLENYLSILTMLWKNHSDNDSLEIENQKRIGKIYEILAKNYISRSEELTIWGRENKILAKDGKHFFYPFELSIVTVDGFRASNLAYAEKLSPEIMELLRLLGVSIIDKVTPSISNSKIEIKGLKNKLLQVSPLIALVAVEKLKNRREWETEFARIRSSLFSFRFYQTSEIYLSYGNEEDRQKRSSWANGNEFYYVGNWFSLRVLDGLVEPLGKFLNIRYVERILTVLLSETFASGIEYLKEKGYDISLIPDEWCNPQEQETATINLWNRPYNQSDEDTGNQGEKFVFEELKRIYTLKYGQPIQETETGFIIGDKLEVFWRNISINTTENHDFKVVELGKDIYIDSKATLYGKNIEKLPLVISGNELALMEAADMYLIARVFNVTTNPEVEFVKLAIFDMYH